MRWLCFVFLAALPLAGQDVSATINGTVRDASGAVILNAKAKLANDNTGIARTVQTNAEGYFVFTDVQVGSYSLTVETS